VFALDWYGKNMRKKWAFVKTVMNAWILKKKGGQYLDYMRNYYFRKNGLSKLVSYLQKYMFLAWYNFAPNCALHSLHAQLTLLGIININILSTCILAPQLRTALLEVRRPVFHITKSLSMFSCISLVCICCKQKSTAGQTLSLDTL
jgi:hypothetical protein